MNATHKRAVSYKLSAPTIRKLADLAAHYEVSATVLIEMLVAERHAALYGTVEHDRKMQALVTALDMSQSDVFRMALDLFYTRAVVDGLVFPEKQPTTD